MTNTAAEIDRKILQQAEETIKKAGDPEQQKFSSGQMQKMLHELRIHQVELELQSEELRRTQQELEISRDRYFDLYNQVPVGYLTISEQGLILESNLTATTLLGQPRKYLCGKQITSFILPEDQDVFYLHSKRAYKIGELQTCEIRMVRADGTLFWSHLQAALRPSGESRVTFNDITKRKESSESAIWLNEERLRLGQEAAHSGTWEWNILTNEHNWSDELWKLYGLEPHSGIASYEIWKQTIHPDDLRKTEQAILDAITNLSELNAEWRIHLPDGTSRWLMARGKPLREESGLENRYLGTIIDITERKQDEEILTFLAQSSGRTTPEEPFFNALARHLARSLDMDFVCIDRLEGDGLTAQTVAVWCDGHFEDNVRYSLKDTPCGDVVGKDICCFPVSVCQLFPHDEALRNLRAESYVGVTLWSRTGKPIGLIAVIGRRPQANRRRAETILKLVAVRAAAELERLDTEEALQRKNIELERFTYTVSHDLKSPLITIQAFAGMILKDMETGNHQRAQDDIKRIEYAASRMTNLLDDLLSLSRVGMTMKDPSPIDMNQIVKDCLSLMAEPLKQKQIDVVVQSDLPGVFGDRQRITEVLQNLVENAIKYMGDQALPRIEIGARKNGKEPVFFVGDNGAGIDTLHHKMIFDLFNRLDAKSKGTGVGLALVKRIIEVHGGRVWVESEGLGQGCRFCFTVNCEG